MSVRIMYVCKAKSISQGWLTGVWIGWVGMPVAGSGEFFCGLLSQPGGFKKLGTCTGLLRTGRHPVH
jgi:hypothetical protein